MASPIWRTWVWASSRSWWLTGKPGVVQSVGHKQLDITELLNWAFPSWGSFPVGCLLASDRQNIRTAGSDGKESTCSAGAAGDEVSIPGLGRSPGERNGYPLQYSCLETSMDRGARRATVHRAAKSRTPLSSAPLSIFTSQTKVKNCLPAFASNSEGENRFLSLKISCRKC